MSLPYEEVYQKIDELEDMLVKAEADPQGEGKLLRQQILEHASKFASSTGEYTILGLPEGSSREDAQRFIDERNELKRRAKEVRLRALKLPV